MNFSTPGFDMFYLDPRPAFPVELPSNAMKMKDIISKKIL